MDVWYKCNNCGKEYPAKTLVRRWEDAKKELPDTCQWCKKGKYIKIKK